MGSLSIWHWLIVLIIGMLLFGGRGKISDIMGDFAKGINSFKKGLKDEDQPAEVTKPIDHKPAEPVATKTEDTSRAG